MDGSLGEASHPKQSLFQFFEISLKMSFHVSSDLSVSACNSPMNQSTLTEAAGNVGLSTRIGRRRK